MNDFSWWRIRTLDGSQNKAFEELVCQLAREEEVEGRTSFTRVAAPDGGVEAYYTLKNGEEYGWQAKFFDNVGDSQWRQIGLSFKNALEKHPKLVKYYVCLPLDRHHPLIHEQKWFMDKWIAKISEWSEFAGQLGRRVQFEYWGSSELLQRLSLEKNTGRRYFWFNEVEFSIEWFKEKLDRSIDALGQRYTPTLNFELDIARVFDGVAYDERLRTELISRYNDLLRKAKKLIGSMTDDRFASHRDKVNSVFDDMKAEFATLDFNELSSIPVERYEAFASNLLSEINKCEESIQKIRDEAKSNDQRETGNNQFSYLSSNLDSFRQSSYTFNGFVKSPTVELANKPVLILRGEAGIGKSHLLADVATKRIQEGKASILLLGQHFKTDSSPWMQILRDQLRLNCTEDEFLGALEARAQASGSRVILFVDAINEGRGRYFWRDYIKPFIRSFEKFKWVGLVLSIRTSYEKLIVPSDSMTTEIAVRITHHGFADVEYEASKLFFDSYGIEQPSIPLLHPEFQNPLFLKLFCEGLYKAGLTRIPEGYEGISAILQFFLRSVNIKLSMPDRLNYPENVNLVEKAVTRIVETEIDNGSYFVEYEKAFQIVETELRKFSTSSGFLESLISEGVFSKNLFGTEPDDDTEGVYLAYERFDDHLRASILIERHISKADPALSFSPGSYLYELLQDEISCHANQGLIEALSIQLPESVGKELYELAPHCRNYYPVVDAFVDSLVWRKTNTISGKINAYINGSVLRYNGTHDKFFETLLLIASNPKHRLNALALHKHLMRFSLADRDAGWSVFIHRLFSYDSSAVKRLIDWAWSDHDRSHISDKSIELTAISLGWFLTSSNRFLRDAATKALVALLENRIGLLIMVLKQFEKVNDPYVLERLHAVAYGCTLRTRQTDELKKLSEYVYSAVFKRRRVYSHILMRDYARGVIEYAKHLGVVSKSAYRRSAPPYESIISKEFPSNEEILKLEFDYNNKDFKDHYWSQNEIIDSMVTEYGMPGRSYGDFGRYVFESAFSDWGITNAQPLANLAIKRVFELGYNVTKHGEFDRTLNSYTYTGRGARKAERIGKKYQWIAFHEILAKVADNFPMYDPSSWRRKRKMKYDGPWEPYVRDIDPSLLIQSTKAERYDQLSHYWWFDLNYGDWDMSNSEWITKTQDLPEPEKLILVKDHQGTDWLVMEVHPEWAEAPETDDDRFDRVHKLLWYQLRSYLVPEKDYKRIVASLETKNFMGRWMPESRHSLYEVFSREYYWSPAYKYFGKPYYHGQEWQTLYDKESRTRLGKVLVPVESYYWEEEYDCSKEETIYFFRPTSFLFSGMKLRFGSIEGQMLDESGDVICLDPSVHYKSLSCLLIRKSSFVEFLTRNKLKVLWTVLGEKLISGSVGARHADDPGRLEISGIYTLHNGQISGKLNSHFKSFR